MPSDDNETSRKCRYRLDTDTSDTLILSDGRSLGYAQYGSLTGRPVFTLHGLPGSRLEVAAWEDVAIRHNARMIAVDRPGIGWSSPHSQRTLLDHARDIQQLANHLELENYAVMGVSGGGPYVLACAAFLPKDKLKGASIVCGLAPSDISKHGMSWKNWLGFALGYRYFPWMCRFYFQRQVIGQLDLDDETRLELMKKELLSAKLHQKDIEWAENEEFSSDLLLLTLKSSRQAFAHGFDGLLMDGYLMSSDFGFQLENIDKDLPIQLWYGKYDTDVPPIHGEQIAARLGSQAQLHLEDETHASLCINHRERILESLLTCL